MDTIETWRSSFGDEYTERNRGLDIGKRVELWKHLLPRGCKSVMEIGCNVGANLEAISLISACEMYACEPNDLALELLMAKDLMPLTHIRRDTADKIGFPPRIADLVFTSGVLIHVPPDKLEASLREIHRCALRWIIVGEYFAPQEEMIRYRGQDGLMWRRDYGSLLLDMFPDLRCIKTIFAWKRMTGLDNLTYWVMEKA